MQSVIDTDKIENIIDKAEMYKNEEEITFDNFNTNFHNILNYYKTKNSNKIQIISKELSDNLKKIIKNHQNNILVLSKNIEKYSELENKNAQIFNDINL